MENLIFNKVDLGDFTFQKWEENPTFIGTFSHISSPMDVETGTARAEGVYMYDLQGNQVNIGQSFKVLDFFLNLEQHEIDVEKDPVFKVTRTGKAATKKGEISLFSFEVAYRK
jgi:hypothetical protein